MGQTPDKEEGKGQHCNASIDTLCIPEVIIKVGVPLPKAEVG